MKKTILTIVLTVLVCCTVLGSTYALLMQKTGTIENTFTVGNINIELTETGADVNGKQTFKIIPGTNITKDPKVTVKANSEACWLFVVVKATQIPDFMTYSVASGWDVYTGATIPGSTIYYRSVGANDAKTGISYPIIAGNTITVSKDVTKAQIDAVTTNPELSFTALAVQAENVTTVDAAWTAIGSLLTNS